MVCRRDNFVESAARKLCSFGLNCLRAGMLGLVTLAVLAAPAAAQRLKTEQFECNFGEAAKSPDGSLRLAMIVGIDDYQSIGDLRGAVNDAGKIYRLIVDDEVNAFPKENVCVLTNAGATYEGFKQAFEKSLIDRAVDKNGKPADQVLFYYAGHGSQLRDDNGDEIDGADETLFLHDSLTRVEPGSSFRIAQLRDDEFNQMLGRLYKKTTNLTVILDSCHSGTATRDPDERIRFVPPDPEQFSRDVDSSNGDDAVSSPDGSPNFAEFTPLSFPNAVFLGAASDGQKAIERAGAGEFTRALVDVLRRRDGPNITYDQLFARIKAELGTTISQVPTLSGASNKFVFTKDVPYRPDYDWTVLEPTRDGVTITGIPTSDIGIGAEFLILPGSMTAEEAQDPDVAKARMRAVSSPSGNVWYLELIEDFGRGKIQPGDFAELVLPAADARRLRVRIRPSSERYGIADPASLRKALDSQKKYALPAKDHKLIEYVDDNFEFEIVLNEQGNLQILDSRGELRNIYDSADYQSTSLAKTISFDLANHLRQITLLNGWKIRGGSMIPNHTLQVWLEPFTPRADQSVCKESYQIGKWRQAQPNQSQDVPLCTAYKIVVKLSDDAPVPVHVAGSVLSATGRMDQLPPGDRRLIRLWKDADGKGQQVDLALFQSGPDSLRVEEYVYVLGLPAISTGGQPVFPIPWRLLSTEASRAVPLGDVKQLKKEYGTYSVVPIRTVANADFEDLTDEAVTKEVATREYTIKKFDISPYLPDSRDRSALYHILKIAEELTNYNKTESTVDGVPYKQHAWCEGTTKKNLQAGIDCSRSIWYAFTRAGIPYNRYATSTPDETQCIRPYDPTKDGYLYTGDMARKDYLMSDNFENCLAPNADGKRELKIGDILVYRDKVKGDGHTVMVIDPEKRIAWGSHGWDGNPKFIDADTGDYPAADLGVEFQKIKIKSDWERWDRSTMNLKACWRHKSFTVESKQPSGRPGLAAICNAALKRDTSYFRSSICSGILEQNL